MRLAVVEFKESSKRYHFNPCAFDLTVGMAVIVETVKGVELGYLHHIKEIDEAQLTIPLKDIIRIATPEDIARYAENLDAVPQIVKQTKDLIEAHQLPMKVVTADYTLDRKRLSIYFEAEGRIDFRDLVKDISEIYHTRIELRQIGSRDTARMIGGIGPCGMVICCKAFIGDFDAVSIKMAKNQNLTLSPQKTTGNCGKLFCCIKYEDSSYSLLREGMPDNDEAVETANGKAYVLGINILKQKVRVRHKEGQIEWLDLKDIKRT